MDISRMTEESGMDSSKQSMAPIHAEREDKCSNQ